MRMEHRLWLGEPTGRRGAESLGHSFIRPDAKQEEIESNVQMAGQLFPRMVAFSQLPRAATAVDQLGLATIHESQEPIGHGIDRHL